MRGLWKGGTEKKEQCGPLGTTAPTELGDEKPATDDRGGRVGDSSLPRTGNAEEAFEVTAGDFEEVGGGEPEGAKEAFGVAGKVKREMTGAGRRDAGEGEVLKENSEFLVMCRVAAIRIKMKMRIRRI
jgi:hypothetical protein